MKDSGSSDVCVSPIVECLLIPKVDLAVYLHS